MSPTLCALCQQPILGKDRITLTTRTTFGSGFVHLECQEGKRRREAAPELQKLLRYPAPLPRRRR